MSLTGRVLSPLRLMSCLLRWGVVSNFGASGSPCSGSSLSSVGCWRMGMETGRELSQPGGWIRCDVPTGYFLDRILLFPSDDDRPRPLPRTDVHVQGLCQPSPVSKGASTRLVRLREESRFSVFCGVHRSFGLDAFPPRISSQTYHI